MTIAIVHEWIEQSGGAEKVLDAMAEAFSDADIYALWNDAPDRYSGRNVYESWLASTPLRKHKAAALPLLPETWHRLKAHRAYDRMLISSHLFAHHARFLGELQDIPKFVYAHTPARYIWTPELDERGNSLSVRLASGALKPLDRKRAQEATAIAANSQFVRERIQKAWDRDAAVIYPPVDIEKIQAVADWRNVLDPEELEILDGLPSEFVLGASRFIPYKRLDLVIEAGARAGFPVVIAGRGPEEERLRALAGEQSVPVEIVISPSDALLYALFQKALAFVFPAIEDFGIMPVEAQAAGCPVVTGPIGGALESVVSGVTGVTVERNDVPSLASAIQDVASIQHDFPADSVHKFGRERFVDEIQAFVGVRTNE